MMHSQSLDKRIMLISHIKYDMVERIISFLPLKQAHELAILSTRFKHSWKFCRDLSFDKNFSKNLSKDEFKNMVNKFFHEHLNPKADIFKLYYDGFGDPATTTQWIKNAIRLKISELELDFTPSSKMFILKYDLINIETVKTVKLGNCELYLPYNSNGLRHLRDLTLQNSKARRITMQAIFMNCLALRNLQLINCCSVYNLHIPFHGSKCLKTLVVKNCLDLYSISINAPKLSTFHFHGKICDMKFYGNYRELNDVILDITYPSRFLLLSHRRDMMIKFSFVRTLKVSSTFIEVLSARFEENEYKELEFCLWNLKEFHLKVAKESFITPSDIVIFLKNCPHIERLFIDLGYNAFEKSRYWDIHGRRYLNECRKIFHFLQIVKVKGFAFKELPVMMGRFFLKNAIYLQSLILVKAKNHNFPSYFTPAWFRYGIQSCAKIEIYEYLNDKSVIFPKYLKD